MKNLNRYLMAGAAVASLSLVASSTAEAASMYAGVFGGLSFLQKPKLKGHSHTYTTTTLTFSSAQSVDASFKTGFVVGGNFGVDWGNGLRTELELAARQNDSRSHAHLKTHYTIGFSTSTTDSTYFTQIRLSSRDSEVPANLHLRAYSLMANAWYDFDTDMGFTPYVGGGFGMAQVQINGSLAGQKLHEKNDTTFAWQLGAGIAVPISDSVKATLDYRYFAADAAKLKIEPGFHGGNVNADFDDHSIMVGLRFNL
jgi:opacity protein-like surface antigen